MTDDSQPIDIDAVTDRLSKQDWRGARSDVYALLRELKQLRAASHTPDFRPEPEFDYHRKQWDKVKSNTGQNFMSIQIRSSSGETHWTSIPNELARDVLARISESER